MAEDATLPFHFTFFFYCIPASLYQINFVGEDGVDAGGVFREGMSRMVEDLFSPDFDLLVQCPNGRHAVGQVGGTSILTHVKSDHPTI